MIRDGKTAPTTSTVAAVQGITGSTGSLPFDIMSKTFGRATDVLSGAVSGLTTGTLGATQASRSQPVGTPTWGSGMAGAQNMKSFSELAAPLDWGGLLGGPAGSYFGAAPPKAK